MKERRRMGWGWGGHVAAFAFAVAIAIAIAHLCCGAVTAAFNVTTLTFEEGFTQLFGDGNLVRSPDDRSVRLLLDRYSGSGFISSDLYSYGLFSAKIKLPSDYAAGVVVAFYTSNGDVFEKTHDELDFEFLGNIRGKSWKVQTNVYGNGSTNRGREERYLLPFDPTLEAHRYSILWAPDTIIFYVDDTPIREVKRNEDMGKDYPSKPMSLYATIWDGSSWATSGGKYKVNYKYSPFISEFSDLVLRGCRIDPADQLQSWEQCVDATIELEGLDLATMTPTKRRAMLDFRSRYMVYSVCYDLRRYPDPLPECEHIEAERQRFKETGHVHMQRVVERRRRRPRRRGRRPTTSTYSSTTEAVF